MKYIQKNPEPQEIIGWKQKFKNKNRRLPQYEDIAHDRKYKVILKEKLLSEQGDVCCYCCKRIGLSDSHIEHFRPKGNRQYRMLSMEYENLLASCQGFHGKGENCGHNKANEYDEGLIISPLEKDCEEHFKFSSRGKIIAADKDNRAACTIELLNLDIPALNAAREAAMWESGAMEDMTEEECRSLLKKYSSKDEKGQYAVFCDAIIYQLKKRLTEITLQ